MTIIQTRPRIVIVGAGFAGLQTAQSLKGANADVVLIEQNSYHTFIPLLYQVATAQLEPHPIAYPLRTILRPSFFSRWRLRRSTSMTVLRSKVQHVHFETKQVETDQGMVPYDYLVLATGSQARSLGVSGVNEYAFTLQTLEDAIALKQHLLTAFEAAALELDPVRREALLSIVIVGGGATGVEMAGALIELVRSALVRDFPTLDLRQVQVILVQSDDRLLPDLPEKLGHYTRRKLRSIGVEVYLQGRVARVTPDAVYLENGQRIPTFTTVWTAGLEAVVPDTSMPVHTTPRGKLPVRPTLQLQEDEQVYALGDAAYVEQSGKPLVGVAPEALQQGVATARNLKRQMQGKAPQPFRYFNKGRLAIIGCYAGVGQIAGISFTGFLPWLMWLGVHLVYLPGLRSRLVVLITWLHSYLMSDRTVRQILSTERRTSSIERSSISRLH